MPSAPKSFSTHPVREGILIGLMVLLSAGLCIWGGYDWVHQILVHGVRDDLEQLARIAAPLVEGDLHEQLTSPEQMNSAEHKKVLTPLVRLHQTIPSATYVYTCILASNQIHFVLDTSVCSNELNSARIYKPSQIMAPYDSPDPAMMLALKKGVVASTAAPLADEFGTFMSGYAPITNSTGKCVGIVGVDLSLADFEAKIGEARRGARYAVAGAILLALVVGVAVWGMRRRALLAEQSNYQSEVARAEQQRILRAVLDNAPIGIWLANLSGKMLFVNRAYCETFGISEERFLAAAHYTDLLDPSLAPGCRVSDQAAAAQSHPHVSHEEFPLANGQRLRLEVLKVRMLDHAGKPAGIIGLSLDVTERDRVQSALRESEQRYRVLLDASPDTVLINRKGRISYVNPAGLRLFGAEQPEQIMARETADLFHPDYRTTLRLEPVLAEQEAGEMMEGKILRLDGRAVEVEISTVPLVDQGIRSTQIILRDITYRRKLEHTLRQSQKLEAIGTLAGGIAHDFNNLLAVIQGNLDMILMESGFSKDASESLIEIGDATSRAATLVQQLLAFSRKTIIQRQLVDLNEIISHLVKMLRRLIREDIDLECQYDTAPLSLLADPVMLDQILINLVVNARDAMPRGGKLTIRAARVHLDDDYHHKHPESRPGHFAQLTVTDTGCGIASEHLPRIFEPFFTTKEVGKGTGLGLATVHGIVQQHEGWIEVDSQIGSGTTFRVYLPLSEITTDKNQHAKKLSTLPGGSETILLVEDEPALLTLVSRVLRHHGYEILEAKSGVAALELWKKHSASIHLLFTDIVMPHGVSGIALANQFQTERPGLKVLLTSGYSQELSQSPPSEAIKWPILEKPCAPWRILEAVRQTLDK